MCSVEKMRGLLVEASKAVCGDRNSDYGDPAVNHERTAEAWCWYLRHRCIKQTADGPMLTINARDVAWMNVLQKISRECHSAKHDNAVDIAGFAANAAACLESPEQKANEAYAEIAS